MFLFPWLEGIEGGVSLTLLSENVSLERVKPCFFVAFNPLSTNFTK